MLRDLGYDDGAATVVTRAPAESLRDLRVILATDDARFAAPALAALRAHGAEVRVVGSVEGIEALRGLDPHLILITPRTSLRDRAELVRRFAQDTRLRWALIDTLPREPSTTAGLEKLLSLCALAVEPDRAVLAHVLLADGRLVTTETLGPARLVRTIAECGGWHHIALDSGAAEAEVDVAQGRIVRAVFQERAEGAPRLEGLAALAALASVRGFHARVEEFTVSREGQELGTVDHAFIASAAPELAWVATHVATGRYVDQETPRPHVYVSSHPPAPEDGQPLAMARMPARGPRAPSDAPPPEAAPAPEPEPLFPPGLYGKPEPKHIVAESGVVRVSTIVSLNTSAPPPRPVVRSAFEMLAELSEYELPDDSPPFGVVMSRLPEAARVPAEAAALQASEAESSADDDMDVDLSALEPPPIDAAPAAPPLPADAVQPTQLPAFVEQAFPEPPEPVIPRTLSFPAIAAVDAWSSPPPAPELPRQSYAPSTPHVWATEPERPLAPTRRKKRSYVGVVAALVLGVATLVTVGCGVAYLERDAVSRIVMDAIAKIETATN